MMRARREKRSRRNRDESDSRLVRDAVVRFVIGSAVALVILAVGTAIIGTRVASQEALREARYRAQLLARNVAAPLVDNAVRGHQPAATARLTSAMYERLRDGSVRHIKLWSQDGTVLWSDESALVGQRYVMPADVRSIFGTTAVTAEVSNLSRAENRNEHEGELLEVYAGVSDADGRPIVFEAYLPVDDLHHDERAIIFGVLAVGLGGLLLFQAAVLPMAVRLARRVERNQAERAKMMRHALAASELERRRMAQELHDGVIQDMAGICFALPTLERQLPEGPGGAEARQTLHSVTGLVQKDATALRSMLLDLYPPDLAGEGFAMALQDIAHSVEERGVAVTVDVGPDLDVPGDVATLAYRVVREGLRNVVKHAQATHAWVTVRRWSGTYEVTVTDDGRGMAPDHEVEVGHLGLQLLRDTINDFGGELDLMPGMAGGAVLRATFPEDLVPT